MRNFKHFSDRELLAPAPQGAVFERLVAEGAIFGKGGYWLSARSAIQPLFHAASLPRYCAPLSRAIDAAVLRAVDAVAAAKNGLVAKSEGGGRQGQEEQEGAQRGREGEGSVPPRPPPSLDMSARICNLTLKALGECVFGVPFDVSSGNEQQQRRQQGATTNSYSSSGGGNGSGSGGGNSSGEESPLVAAAHVALEGQITGMAFGLLPPVLRPLVFWLVRRVPTPGLARLAAARRVLCGVALVLSRNAVAGAAAAGSAAGAKPQPQQHDAPPPLTPTTPTPATDRPDEAADLLAMQREFFGKSSDAVRAAQAYQGQAPAAGSALDCLSRARNRADALRPLRLRHLVAQANSLLIAGHDTTGMALSAALLFLSTHPEAERALAAEVDAFFQGAARAEKEEEQEVGGRAVEKGDAAAESDDERMCRYLAAADVAGSCFPYADAVLKEAVRLLPPGWMTTRLAVAGGGGGSSGSGGGSASVGGGSAHSTSGGGGNGSSDDGGPQVAGVPVPDGTLVYLDIWGIHHHPEYWPEPLAFKPERFLGQGAGSPGLCAAAAAAAEAAAELTRAGGRRRSGSVATSGVGAGISVGGQAVDGAPPASWGSGGGGGGGVRGGGGGGSSLAATGGGVGASSAGAHPYAWLGFGAGPRLCVGYKFAIVEAKVTLARLYRRYTFRVDEARTPLSRGNWAVAGVPHTMVVAGAAEAGQVAAIPRLRPGVTLGFRDPLWMVPTPREQRRTRSGAVADGAVVVVARAGGDGEAPRQK